MKRKLEKIDTWLLDTATQWGFNPLRAREIVDYYGDDALHCVATYKTRHDLVVESPFRVELRSHSIRAATMLYPLFLSSDRNSAPSSCNVQ